MATRAPHEAVERREPRWSDPRPRDAGGKETRLLPSVHKCHGSNRATESMRWRRLALRWRCGVYQ
jgi:hypothetical protein